MAVLTEELLARVGVERTPKQFTALVADAVATMPELGHDETYPPLTEDQQAALRRGGFSLHPVDLGEDDPIAQTAAAYAALVGTSLTVAEAARLLGVDPSRIRQRLLARTLIGIKLGQGWRLPRWQFDDARVLPGLEVLAPRFAPHLSPLIIRDWMLRSEPDFADETHEALSPRDWLRLGYDPMVLAPLAADLGRGI